MFLIIITYKLLYLNTYNYYLLLLFLITIIYTLYYFIFINYLYIIHITNTYHSLFATL